MSLRALFKEIFGPAWNEAETVAVDVEHELGAVIHLIDKEFNMVPQNITDALARIKAALAGGSDQNAALQQQVTDLTGKLSDANAALADAQQQLSDIEAAVLAAAPAA